MNGPNSDFDDLALHIALYCDNRRFPSKQRASAPALRGIARRTLLSLTSKFDDGLPDHVFVHELITKGVQGTASNDNTIIWNRYYVAGEPISKVASRLRCSNRAVFRRLKSFPINVAIQLWEKNLDLSGSRGARSLRPTTRTQLRTRALKDEFGLTPRQVEVLLAFYRPGKSRTRKKLAEDDLFISLNTLKSHIRNILRKMECTTMNEAIDKAEPIFQKIREREQKEIE